MAKQIKFKHKTIDYTLEFTRKSIETMERGGFRLDDIVDKPMLTLPVLFAGAFMAHHRFEKKETIDDIFKMLPNKSELLNTLAEMYNEPLATLMEDPDETEGKLEWGKSW